MNPFAFRPAQVTVWTTLTYLALLIPLIILNETVPAPPSSPTPYKGVNLTEAWLDLAALTEGYHPYNSHKNDQVRDWLLLRIQQILENSGADWTSEPSVETKLSDDLAEGPTKAEKSPDKNSIHGVTVFNDRISNVTLSFNGQPGSPASSVAAYFEGTNVIVYIRGSEDENGSWWKRKGHRKLPIGGGGVMVNAHYDSVSTGYGATDDGMGVITVLQLIKYFTTPGNQPKHGVVALLNNGEEDFLYGARAFGKSPVMPFAHTFLNLEGAGAGNRAILFRGTDQQVMSSYAKSPHPFSSVIASDAFGMGVIKSQTDYIVFNGIFGQRGLDLSFFKPRSRYHTQDDDLRHTSRASLWHMLSASVATMKDLTSKSFLGDRPDGDSTKVPNGKGSDGVWFDLLGSTLVLFNLRGMFAWSLTLLIATPLILMLLTYLAQKRGKYYYFRKCVSVYEHPGANANSERVKIGGTKGIVRFPLALVVSGTLVFGGAFLLRKENPFIVHSCRYTVWAMFVSIAYFSFWCVMKGADAARPSALHRGYVHIWLFTLGWILLVVVTVFEDRFNIASGYYVVFLHSALFLTTLVALSEVFALPNMDSWGQEFRAQHEGRDDHSDDSTDAIIAPSPEEIDGAKSDEDEEDGQDREPDNATTPLLGRPGRGDGERRTTFATTYRRSIAAVTGGAPPATPPAKKKLQQEMAQGHVGDEQPWSKNLPSWTWLIQFAILGPFMIIVAVQTGLMLTDATHQIAVDGSNPLLPYLTMATFSLLLILPLMPLMHRVTHHIPLFLLCVFFVTLAYNLVAFPFSPASRYKAFWHQAVNLDTGVSIIKLGGVEEYLRRIIAELPSAAGKSVDCHASTIRVGITDCDYDGTDIPPNVAGNVVDDMPPLNGYNELVSLQVTPGTESGQAKLRIDAKNTKSCYLKFAKPLKKCSVVGGSGWDDRFGRFPDNGLNHILLWRRDWDKLWEVDIAWDTGTAKYEIDEEAISAESMDVVDELRARTAKGLYGNVTCIWSDLNTPGTIPALDEAIRYAPAWATFTKFTAGLVEGTKSFVI